MKYIAFTGEYFFTIQGSILHYTENSIRLGIIEDLAHSNTIEDHEWKDEGVLITDIEASEDSLGGIAEYTVKVKNPGYASILQVRKQLDEIYHAPGERER